MKKQIVIFGTGPIAEVAGYYFENDSEYSVAAFTVDDAYFERPEFDGKPVVPLSKLREAYPPETYDAFVAISYTQMNKIREQKYMTMKELGYRLVSYISSKCTCFTKLIGDNCLILEDNTIQPFVKIGNNVTLWSGNHIGHHSEIADHCFLASQIVVSGGVKIESNCFVGVNATLRDHITISRETLIGAGCVILKDTTPRSVYKASAATLAPMTSDLVRL